MITSSIDELKEPPSENTSEPQDPEEARDLNVKDRLEKILKGELFDWGRWQRHDWSSGPGFYRDVSSIPVVGEQYRTGLESLLWAMVVGSWTAFETLASDLWVACLNARPRLALVALGAEPEPEDNEDTATRKMKMKIELPIWMMRYFDYKFCDHMGTLLLNSKKWNFDRRNEAKDAYLKAFRQSEQDVKTLSDIFNDEKLQWLAATRNACVHQGGIADREFVKLVTKHPVLQSVPKDRPIPLDGSIVNEFVAAAQARGTELIRFVDIWLRDNRI